MTLNSGLWAVVACTILSLVFITKTARRKCAEEENESDSSDSEMSISRQPESSSRLPSEVSLCTISDASSQPGYVRANAQDVRDPQCLYPPAEASFRNVVTSTSQKAPQRAPLRNPPASFPCPLRAMATGTSSTTSIARNMVAPRQYVQQQQQQHQPNLRTIFSQTNLCPNVFDNRNNVLGLGNTGQEYYGNNLTARRAPSPPPTPCTQQQQQQQRTTPLTSRVRTENACPNQSTNQRYETPPMPRACPNASRRVSVEPVQLTPRRCPQRVNISAGSRRMRSPSPTKPTQSELALQRLPPRPVASRQSPLPPRPMSSRRLPPRSAASRQCLPRNPQTGFQRFQGPSRPDSSLSLNADECSHIVDLFDAYFYDLFHRIQITINMLNGIQNYFYYVREHMQQFRR